MGRVSTATDVVLGTPQSLSLAVGAVLVEFLSYRAIYFISAAVMLVAAALSPARSLGGGTHVTVGWRRRQTARVGGVGCAEVGEDLPEVEPSRLDRQRHE